MDHSYVSRGGGSRAPSPLRFRRSALALAASCALGATGAAQAAVWTVCASGCNYTTIQGAINAASTVNGDTIDVKAGIYPESVVINKQLTLLGAQAGVDPVVGGRGGPGESAIASSYPVSIQASNVTVKGFEIADFRYGVFVPAAGFTANGGTLQNIEVSYNWIHSNVAESGVGFGAEAGLLQGLKIDHNLFFVDSIVSGRPYALAAIGFSGSGTVQTYENVQVINNWIETGPVNAAYGLFAGADPGKYLINGMVITGNYFKGYTTTPSGSATLNLGNILNGQFSGNLADGVRGTIGIENGTISGNTFRPGSALNLWGTVFGFTRPSKNISIVNNDFGDSIYGRGLLIDSYADNPFGYTPTYGPPAIDASTIGVHVNSFLASATVGGDRIRNFGTGNTLDATYNWWGLATGPDAARLVGYPITTSPWITGYTDDPAKLTPPTTWPLSVVPGLTRQTGFWPVNQVGISFDGEYVDPDQGSTTLKATLTGATACTSGAPVTFTWTNLVSGATGTVTIVTNGSGVAQTTLTFPVGQMIEVVVSVPTRTVGGVPCLAASDEGTTVVADPNAASTGGGWYKVAQVSPPRMDFGYTVQSRYDRKSGTTAISGNLVWHHQNTNRFKGTVTSYGRVACPATNGFSTCAQFSGSGTMWTINAAYDPADPTSKKWIGPQTVTFTALTYDGGIASKKGGPKLIKPDAFGVRFDAVSLPGESAPMPLNGGSITVK